MVTQLFTSSSLDSDGRQTILSDTIHHIHYYSTENETWDKTGQANQSWFNEKFIPNDSFDTTTIALDKWVVIDTPPLSDSTVIQAEGKLTLGIEKDEGNVALTSDGVWSLVGDFDLRLYIDWNSYYNEYRGLTHTYLKVGVDSENAARVSFHFDGTSFSFVAEKTVARDLLFFDWKDSGAATVVSSITVAQQVQFLQITRISGVISMFTSDGSTSTQVGSSASDTVFTGNVFVEFGVEAKEFNTYRSAFTKFFVSSGTTAEGVEFFSSTRGVQQSFPDRALIAVDSLSLSIIDEVSSNLWARFTFGEGSPLVDSNVRVHACSGVIYCTTADGLIAFDFHRDKIFKYKDTSILVANEPLALRNAGVSFSTFIDAIGTIPSNTMHDVACISIGAEDYIAIVSDAGVAVLRALSSGIASSAEGPLPGSLVGISTKGSLYWSGFNPTTNAGELSWFSNITVFSGPTDTTFSRTGFYNEDTALNILGSNITSFSIQTEAGVDLVAVGTTEGLTFVALSPGAPFTKTVTYGVSSPPVNPITDPSFENYIGVDWVPFVSGGFHESFIIQRTTDFVSGAGIYGLQLGLEAIPVGALFEAGMTLGVKQTVDLTGIESLYFDIKMEKDINFTANNLWDFEVSIGGTVVKSYTDLSANFTKTNDTAPVLSFTGLQVVSFQIQVKSSINSLVTSERKVYIDNIRTGIGNPDFSIMPAGNASVKEVLLQYDGQGHKIYFSTAGGYGAVDLDDNSLDYFIPLDTFGPESTEVISSEFSRVVDEV